MIALILGTLLATGALAVVLYPLFDERPRPPGRERAPGPGTSRSGAVDALREIEFDRETGKRSDDDYAALKGSYTRAALEELRAGEALAASTSAMAGGDSSGVALDAAETLVRSLRASRRSCGACGPRPEPDALFCSECGRFLAGACDQCGAPATEPGSRFCVSCGSQLAASAA